MSDLVTFLEARLAEDEATVSEIHQPRVCGSVDRDGEFDPDPIWCSCDYPARVLREVAARRHILDLFMSTAALVEHPPVMSEGHPYAGKISAQDYFDARRELAVLRPVVVALAAIYSDHPDYRQEWKP